MTANSHPQACAAHSLVLTRWLFLRLLGAIYFMAFASYAVQILGLNGSHGVIPTGTLLKEIAQQLGSERFWMCPTIAWANASDMFLKGMTGAGTLLSLSIVLGIATGPSLALCMVLWLSVCTGGGEFTGFQSDGMLVEATLLSLFIVPWQMFEPPWPVPFSMRRQSPPSKVGIWLLRFFTFRLMFAAGAVKLLSGDPTWASLTALHYHFETQPLPTPLAWYAHWLPDWMLKFSVLAMFVSELVAPLLIFGTSITRYIAAALMIGLQMMIALTGNYTFLNYLLMVLCVPLLDDRLVGRLLPKRLAKSIESSVKLQARSFVIKWATYVAAAMLFFLAGSQLIITFVGGYNVPTAIRLAVLAAAPLHIADRYGLFAVMTTTRPEIVFEGSNDGKRWLAYEMRYKVENPATPPPWVAPHMPRLSWRLWFAAMEPAEASPWVLSLVEQMLQGSPDVLQFFAVDPFAGKPPRYIRAWVYDYHFTDAATRKATGDWWRRDNQRVFLPPLTLKDGKLEVAPLENTL